MLSATSPARIWLAAGALLAYVDETQKGKLPRIKALAKRAPGASMSIDPATRRSLELTRTLSGERKGSLLHDIDRTVTARRRAPVGGTSGRTLERP